MSNSSVVISGNKPVVNNASSGSVNNTQKNNGCLKFVGHLLDAGSVVAGGATAVSAVALVVFAFVTVPQIVVPIVAGVAAFSALTATVYLLASIILRCCQKSKNHNSSAVSGTDVKLQKELATAKKAIAQKDKELAKAQGDAKDLKDQIEAFKALPNNADELKKRVEKYKAKKVVLKEQVKIANSEIELAKVEKEKHLAQHQLELKQKDDELLAAVGAHSKELSENLATISDLTAAAEGYKATIADHENKTLDLKKLVADAEAQASAAADNLDQANAHLKALEKEKAEAQATIEHLENSKKDAEALASGKVDERLVELNQQLEAKQKELESAAQSIQKQEENIQALEQQRQEAEQLAEVKTKELEDITLKLAEVAVEAGKLKDAIIKAQEAELQTQEQIKQLQGEVDNGKALAQDAAKQLEVSKAQIDEKVEEIKTAQVAIDAHEATIVQLQGEVANISAQAKAAATEIAQKEAQIAEHKAKIDEHEKTLADQKGIVEAKDSEIAENKNAIAAHLVTIAEHEKAIADQKALVAEKESEIVKITAQLADLKVVTDSASESSKEGAEQLEELKETIIKFGEAQERVETLAKEKEGLEFQLQAEIKKAAEAKAAYIEKGTKEINDFKAKYDQGVKQAANHFAALTKLLQEGGIDIAQVLSGELQLTVAESDETDVGTEAEDNKSDRVERAMSLTPPVEEEEDTADAVTQDPADAGKAASM